MTTTAPAAERPDVIPGRRGNPLLAAVLAALAVGMASVSVLGPLLLGLLTYRTSVTTLNQLEGADAAVLVVVAPAALVAALLAVRGHRAAGPLAAGLGAFAVYTYAQVVIGQEYLRLPGNVERWFPLLLLVFVLAEAAVVLGVRETGNLPPPSPRVRRTASAVLVLLAVFLTVGQHLRPLLLAWRDPGSLVEYASSPTPFWLVKLMDLGIVVPAALTAGIGLVRGASWALRIAYPLLTAYTFLGLSVTAMALLMNLRADPGASPGLAVGFAAFTAVFAAVTALLYRPLLRPGPSAP